PGEAAEVRLIVDDQQSRPHTLIVANAHLPPPARKQSREILRPVRVSPRRTAGASPMSSRNRPVTVGRGRPPAGNGRRGTWRPAVRTTAGTGARHDPPPWTSTRRAFTLAQHGPALTLARDGPALTLAQDGPALGVGHEPSVWLSTTRPSVPTMPRNGS